MSRFVTLDEAAQQLGMSAEELVEARSSGEIHGYRDGSSWKFKAEEVQRFAAERGESAAGQPPRDDLLGDDDDQQDAVLLSDEQLNAGDAGSSTIIGAGKGGGVESDIQLAAPDSDLSMESDIELDAGSDVLASPTPRPRSASDSDVQLVPDAEGSDVRVVPGSSSNILGASGMDELNLEEGSGTDELKLETGGSSGTGELAGGTGSSDLGLGSSQILGDDDEEVLSLSDEDDLVLAGSGTGSDITMGSDTGINLTNPSDSGLLLEDEALDLGSVSSLELPEDQAEDALGEEGDEAAAGVKPEEDFNLGPTEVAVEPDDEGSSQVIKLEADAFGTEGMEGVEPLGEGVGFEAEGGEEVLIAEEDVEELEVVGPAAGQVEDISFSAVNIAWLSCGVLVLALSGILMIDVVRNMWSWNEATANSLASGIMEGIVSAVGMNR
jgi:excisionase family DNA binding protein